MPLHINNAFWLGFRQPGGEITTTIAADIARHGAKHVESSVGQLRDHDPHYGFSPVVFALVFGLASGSSLPLGAWLGILNSPVGDKTCALMMAFGAGALLFAVTVELYGHALAEVAKGELGLFEMFATIFGALSGAAFYLTINKWLDEQSKTDSEEITTNHSSWSLGSPGTSARQIPDMEASTSLDSTMAPVAKALRDGQKAEEQTKNNAKACWKKVRASVSTRTGPFEGLKINCFRTRERTMMAAIAQAWTSHKIDQATQQKKAKSVALSLFLGLLVDGVPEGILMGFLSAEGHLTPVLIISLFIANFPESFSSASLLMQAQMSKMMIIGMWAGLCLLVGTLCGLSCFLLLLAFPSYGAHGHGEKLPATVSTGIALVEGITGGAMIACISSVMLPEAFERAGKSNHFYQTSGFMCTAGFLLSVALKATFG